MENGCSGHQNLSAGCDDIRQVIGINPSIDLDNTSIVAAFDDLPCLADFLQRIRNEFLAPKARVHTHDQYHISQTEGMLDGHKWCCWIN